LFLSSQYNKPCHLAGGHRCYGKVSSVVVTWSYYDDDAEDDDADDDDDDDDDDDNDDDDEDDDEGEEADVILGDGDVSCGWWRGARND